MITPYDINRVFDLLTPDQVGTDAVQDACDTYHVDMPTCDGFDDRGKPWWWSSNVTRWIREQVEAKFGGSG